MLLFRLQLESSGSSEDTEAFSNMSNGSLSTSVQSELGKSVEELECLALPVLRSEMWVLLF